MANGSASPKLSCSSRKRSKTGDAGRRNGVAVAKVRGQSQLSEANIEHRTSNIERRITEDREHVRAESTLTEEVEKVSG
jgi:hypothetical protein